MSTQATPTAAATAPAAGSVPLRLEVVVIPVTDVDRAKAFYEGLGWRLDADFPGPDGYRVIQFTPPGSATSVIFGAGVVTARPGAGGPLMLAVDDLDAAVTSLRAGGADVSDPFHDAGGGLGGGLIAGTDARAPGRDPEGRSYASYASFSDPDGNGWLLQEITERLPGRV